MGRTRRWIPATRSRLQKVALLDALAGEGLPCPVGPFWRRSAMSNRNCRPARFLSGRHNSVGFIAMTLDVMRKMSRWHFRDSLGAPSGRRPAQHAPSVSSARQTNNHVPRAAFRPCKGTRRKPGTSLTGFGLTCRPPARVGSGVGGHARSRDRINECVRARQAIPPCRPPSP